MAAVSNLEQGRFGYLKPKDVARLAEAYRFSEAAHAGQTRQSGDPYISHPLAVAEILAGWHLDGQVMPRRDEPVLRHPCSGMHGESTHGPSVRSRT